MRYEYTVDPRIFAPRPGAAPSDAVAVAQADAEMRGQIVAALGGVPEITPALLRGMDDVLFYDTLRRAVARVTAVADAVPATVRARVVDQGHRLVAELVTARLATSGAPTLETLAAQWAALLGADAAFKDQGVRGHDTPLYVGLLVHASAYVNAASAVVASVPYDARSAARLLAVYATLVTCIEFYPPLAALAASTAARAAKGVADALGCGSGAEDADAALLAVLHQYAALTDRMEAQLDGSAAVAIETLDGVSRMLRARVEAVAATTARAVVSCYATLVPQSGRAQPVLTGCRYAQFNSRAARVAQAARIAAAYTIAAVEVARAADPWQTAMQSVSFVMQPPPAHGPVRRIGDAAYVGHGGYKTATVRDAETALARADAWGSAALGAVAAAQYRAVLRGALDARLAETLRTVDNPDAATRQWVTYETHALARILGACAEVARFARETLCVNLDALAERGDSSERRAAPAPQAV